MAHLHSIILAAILVVIGPGFALGQNVSGKRRPPQSSQVGKSVKPAENPEVRSLLNDSESLPAEFSADVSLALVENGLIRNGTLKARVITRAFEKASAAEDDVMRRPFGVNVEETSQGLHAIASSVTRFNRVSLQARAVQQVAAADPRKVRQLFESMQGPQLIPVSCNQPWFFVPDAYYDALATVL